MSDRLPRGSNKGQKAICHPERNAVCKRLCQACYVRHRLRNKVERATCHPDRAHLAKGLCRNCYRDKNRRGQTAESKSALWRRAALKYNFGITVDDYTRILASQGGCCAMCGVTEGNAKGRRLAVDHDHDSGRVRGLLCFRCNTALGVYEKMGDVCAEYLRSRVA